MSSLFTNLLFLHGHITDPELARRLANTPEPTSRPTGKRERTPRLMEAVRKNVAPSKLAHSGCG
ncbi:hypothetical protein SAMN04487785_111146 [Dyella jiangningensis]|uniref:hypothetical protein n=1 Tax=Dyella sp. AtDHG13 TaxID=1938897 RepID=UPI000887F2E1|nr:hypothetical protein [Dyella sp. AtDHG13]PXV55302.1 hypothetical protein BDW41_1117 [Dyella sp. AtDHG13]SDK81750.1 hypothetical protein SAMN04487785_111146 [Dyella jiangningensis]